MADNKKKTIKDLPEDERPREKLVAKGAENLKDSELWGTRKLLTIE